MIMVTFVNTSFIVQADATKVGAGIWGLVRQSGAIATFVLVVLGVFSILSIGIILRKFLTFRRIEKQSQGFIKLFRRSSRLSEIDAGSESFEESPLASLFQAGYTELNTQINGGSYKTNPRSQVTVREGATIKSLEAVRRALQRAASAELTTLERSLNWLATIGSTSPFIGLFGTVIGIINAFQGLGAERTTTIQAVAPGIAEALITTAAGLFAAIPAVIAYNHYVSRIRTLAAEMDDFSLEFLNLVERNFT